MTTAEAPSGRTLPDLGALGHRDSSWNVLS